LLAFIASDFDAGQGATSGDIVCNIDARSEEAEGNREVGNGRATPPDAKNAERSAE